MENDHVEPPEPTRYIPEYEFIENICGVVNQNRPDIFIIVYLHKAA